MNINSISSVSFRNKIKVTLPDKTLNKGGYKKGDLGKVLDIASKNEVGAYIGEDVFLLGSSQAIKEDLKKAGLNFEEIKDKS